MKINHEYFDIARQNEELFRTILLDLKTFWSFRPHGQYSFININTDGSLEEIFNSLSKTDNPKLTTYDFTLEDKVATITIGYTNAATGDGIVQYAFAVFSPRNIMFLNTPFFIRL